MSQENVEIVKLALAAYSGTGDVPEDLFDSGIEVWESPELPGDLAGKGHANLVRVKEILLDSFEEWSIEPEKFFDLGERVLVFVRFRVKGKESGVPVDGPLAYLVTLQDGKVTAWGLFGDRGKALEAAGVSE